MLLPGLLLSAVATAPPLPYVDWGACPFECCVYREWRARRAVTVRRARSARSPVAFTLGAGEAADALTGVVITWRPTRVRMRRPHVFQVEESRRLEARQGDVLHLLTSRGEGFFAAWFKGRLVDSIDASFLHGKGCGPPSTPDCPGVVEEQGRSSWWVKLRHRNGKIGWSAEPEAFDHTDACG